jgi:hypothetical protein
MEEVDLDRAVNEPRRRYPGLCCWWGEYTGSLWALLPDQLVEAKTAFDLAQRIDAIIERSVFSDEDRPAQRQAPTPPFRTLHGTWDVPGKQASSTPSSVRSTDLTEKVRQDDLLCRLAAGCRRVLLRGARALAHAR